MAEMKNLIMEKFFLYLKILKLLILLSVKYQNNFLHEPLCKVTFIQNSCKNTLKFWAKIFDVQ